MPCHSDPVAGMAANVHPIPLQGGRKWLDLFEVWIVYTDFRFQKCLVDQSAGFPKICEGLLAPRNWFTPLPVCLDALNQTRRLFQQLPFWSKHLWQLPQPRITSLPQDLTDWTSSSTVAWTLVFWTRPLLVCLLSECLESLGKLHWIENSDSEDLCPAWALQTLKVVRASISQRPKSQGMLCIKLKPLPLDASWGHPDRLIVRDFMMLCHFQALNNCLWISTLCKACSPTSSFLHTRGSYWNLIGTIILEFLPGFKKTEELQLFGDVVLSAAMVFPVPHDYRNATSLESEKDSR